MIESGDLLFRLGFSALTKYFVRNVFILYLDEIHFAQGLYKTWSRNLLYLIGFGGKSPTNYLSLRTGCFFCMERNLPLVTLNLSSLWSRTHSLSFFGQKKHVHYTKKMYALGLCHIVSCAIHWYNFSQ